MTMAAEGMITRAIVAFPMFADPDAATQLEELRRRFDPLATAIAAHLTLVFRSPELTVYAGA
jgi:hypothetical protein